MNILVVNDDGIEAQGLEILARKMQAYGSVFVVAPHDEQSAIGHGITIRDPLKLHRRDDLLDGIESWSLEAKPADCVKFALYGLKLDIDLVVSGVNNGPNLGTDIIYSGTLAGASEGVICDLPAVAFSTDFNNFDIVENELDLVFRKILDSSLMSNEIVLNVNFPAKEFDTSRGIRVCEMGHRPFAHEFLEDNGAYWARGTWDVAENGDKTDVWAYENGYTSISPIQINRTSYRHLEAARVKLEGDF